MAPLMLPPPMKKSHQPPSKAARDNYYARKSVDEVFKAQSKRSTAKQLSNNTIMRNRYERRLERTLQAIQALPDHQTTDCLPKTGQAIRAVLADKKRRPGKIGLAEGVGSTKATAAQLEKKPLGFKSVDDLRCTGAEDSVSAILRAPVTPRSYHAPMSPPPAPRKPRGRRL